MKTGIELITIERNEVQIGKYGFTGEHHADHPEWYDKGQLTEAAWFLIRLTEAKHFDIEAYLPKNWNLDWWVHMCNKTSEERLIIAGALIAAEIDRLNEVEKRKKL